MKLNMIRIGSGNASASMRSNGCDGVDGVEQLGGGRADARLHLVDPPRREGAGGGLAQPAVRGRVEAHHRRLRLVAAVEQRLAHLGRQLR